MERATRPENGAEIARIFQRIFAAIIDAFLLGLVFIFGVVGFVGWLRPEALLIQTLISFAYFAVLNSRLGGGATIGKRMMGIRVITRGGDTIGIVRGMWRAGFDMIPTTAATFLPLLYAGTTFPIAATASAVTTGFGLANIVLYLFNWRTRQVLHDLVAGTFVVQEETCDRPVAGHTPWGQIGLAAGIIAVSGLVGMKVADFQRAVVGDPICVQSMAQSVQSLPFVERVYVDDNPWGPGAALDPAQRSLIAFVREGDANEQEREIARKSLEACPPLHDDHTITVMLLPPHEHYSLVPAFAVARGSVKEWRDSFVYEARSKRQESACKIEDAVGSLKFVATASVTDRYAGVGAGFKHFKTAHVRLSDSGMSSFVAAREAARQVVTVCPAMDNATVLTVDVTPAAGGDAESFPNTVEQWREGFAYQLRVEREARECDFSKAVKALPFAASAKVSNRKERYKGRMAEVKQVEVTMNDSGMEPISAAREVARSALTTCPQIDKDTVMKVLIAAPGAEPHGYIGTADDWRGFLLSRRASPRPGFRPPTPNGQ